MLMHGNLSVSLDWCQQIPYNLFVNTFSHTWWNQMLLLTILLQIFMMNKLGTRAFLDYFLFYKSKIFLPAETLISQKSVLSLLYCSLRILTHWKKCKSLPQSYLIMTRAKSDVEFVTSLISSARVKFYRARVKFSRINLKNYPICNSLNSG